MRRIRMALWDGIENLIIKIDVSNNDCVPLLYYNKKTQLPYK